MTIQEVVEQQQKKWKRVTCPACQGIGADLSKLQPYFFKSEITKEELDIILEKDEYGRLRRRPCPKCEGLGTILKRKTNADAIRELSTEELAKYLHNVNAGVSEERWLDWLRQPKEG